MLFDLCRSIWIIDLLFTHPSPHFRALTRPSTPKVLQVRERAPTPYPSVVFTLDSYLSLSKNWGVRHHCLERPWLWVFFIRFFNAKANFTIITCICDHESFKSLLTTVNKLIFVTKISFEFGQFMAQKGEVPFQSTTLLNIHVLMYTYLFHCTIGTNAHVDILASKKSSTLIKSIVSVFPRDRQLYK